MIGICLESSHARGMGHFYRMLNLIDFLRKRGERPKVMLNADAKALALLNDRGVDSVTVNLDDFESGWETELTKRYGLTVWINDRLDTDIRHAKRVVENGVRLVTFDDRGTGAAFADLHFAPLLFSGCDLLQGKQVFTGTRYLILSKEIEKFRRVRNEINSILVTMGGSDTYGVTLQVAAVLHGLGLTATIVTGPSFRHDEELERIAGAAFIIKKGVPSLIEEFARHDLAITGGGMTPFEANASGLPCVIVANEPHEIEIGEYLAGLGSSYFSGYYRDLDKTGLNLNVDVETMSRAGLAELTIDGCENIYREIQQL